MVVDLKVPNSVDLGVRTLNPSLDEFPTLVLSLKGDSVTSHLETLVPMGTLGSDHLGNRTLRSSSHDVRSLKLDTLDISPVPTGFGTSVPKELRTPGYETGRYDVFILEMGSPAPSVSKFSFFE